MPHETGSQLPTRRAGEQVFAASEIGEYENCPLSWWYARYEPHVDIDTEELFAELVEMEQAYGPQAAALPEYLFIEKLLLQRGAFEEEHQQQGEHAQQVTAVTDLEEMTEEWRGEEVGVARRLPQMRTIIIILIVFAIVCISVAVVTVSSILLSIGLGLLLLTIALLILIHNERKYQRRRWLEEHRRLLGLPSGDLVYEGVDGQGEVLYSDQVPLVGKPDYIIQRPNGPLVPIELKLSFQNVASPHSNHVVQIAAYCLILEDYSEVPPTHGILRYANGDFTVYYTPTLRKKVIRLLAEMQDYNEKRSPQLARQRVTKCRVCTFQPICPIGQGK